MLTAQFNQKFEDKKKEKAILQGAASSLPFSYGNCHALFM
jgi:hypothetical protein